MTGWIGVDLDGTLARYDGWRGPEHIGDPVPEMVGRVKQWLVEGRDVRIFTGRIAPCVRRLIPAGTRPTPQDVFEAFQAAAAITAWCETHLGQRIPITCIKDLHMLELWDDRAV